ncbi:hypothetical protein F4809DRAFT_601867 [Biscogniauxia mediterranea]|nr:hypothetical protein F4809DRAFT_601867 [Biscogniauxia mediterranea]
MSWNPSDFSPGTMDNADMSLNANANASTNANAQLQQPSPSTVSITTTTTTTTTNINASTPQYTTVGSIYHPQPQPLQPPARRGRTVKSLFPYRNESAPATHNHHHPPPPLQQHHQYSPLQQNFDRAMSPVQNRNRPNLKLDFSPNPIDISLSDQESVFAQHFGASVPNMQLTHSPAVNADLHVGQSPDKQDDANMNHEGTNDLQDEHDLKKMVPMNFKSISNLASYPNPMQKTAQKLLSSHRPLPASTNSPGQPKPLIWRGQAPNAHKDQKTPAMGIRSVKSDPLSVACMLQADSIDEHVDFNRPSRFGPGANPWPLASRNSLYDAVLSKGPGAPAPLTAGPPGQRQYKPSTLESTVNVSQNDLQRPQDVDDNAQQQRPAASTERQLSPSFGSDGASSHPIPHSHKSNGKVVDTLTAEEASVFYPNGFPPDFNHHTPPINSRFPFEYKRDDQFSDKKDTNIWAARMAKVEHEFYLGNLIFNKEFDMAVAEKNSRDFARAMGSTYEPKRDEGKVANRKLDAKQASAIPIEKHALHLVSMTYQTLVTRLEQEASKKIPKSN